MAIYTIDKIGYDGNTYILQDSGALQLTGGNVTGPVNFGDSVTMDEATIGDLIVNGAASFTNNIQANTINGVTVGSNPKFTDTVTTVTTTGSGNAITAISASNGAITATKGTTFLTSHQDISGKANKATTLSGYGITDAYTKAQVDGLVASVFHYKGTKAAVSNLPTSGNAIGDVWHVTANGGEYAWDGSAWQELGSVIDLSNYKTKQTAVTDPTASSTTSTTFIDSISQDANGKISVTKKTLPTYNNYSHPTYTSATAAAIKVGRDSTGHVVLGNALTASDVGALPSNTTYVSTITTTAGAHTAITSKKGDVSFNVPTKTSHLTNDSGFITNAGVTGVKGNSESSYRTGQVNLSYENVGAIGANVSGNTHQLIRPIQMNGLNDNTLDQKISFLRANRLMFLPADQIIIEKTTDGGTTWVDAGYTDIQKRHLFAETQGAGISVPLLNGARSTQCGLRITITGMKYNVPAGTAETAKYNYWNSNYVQSQERYCQLKEIYFWVSTANAGLSCKIERATGANSTSWVSIYDSGSTFALTGWSGNDYVRFSQSVFGGGTTQTGNYWNYRFTFFQRSSTGTTTLPDTYTTSAGTLYEIRGYGDTSWSTTAVSHQFMNNDHIYKWDLDKNTTFPAQVTATDGFSGNLTGNVTGNVSGTAANVTGTVAIANGGTGATSAVNAINNLLTGLPVWSAVPTDTTYFIRQDTGGADSYGKVPASTLWSYISGKLPSWSQASSKPSYNFSEIGSKPTTIAGYGITDAILFGGVDTGLGSGTPAANVKTYYSDTTKVPTNSIKGFLNSSGVEYTTLFSNRGTYGSVLKWGYNDRYIYILRNKAGTWQSTDWEKISAGYADTAGSASSVTWDNVSGKPTFFSGNYNDLTNKPTIPTVPSNIVNTITTTAGAHTAITNKSGAVSFNVPTKTSHLTNDSGFLTAHNTYTISTTGSGNAVTAVSLSGTTFTVTKGATYNNYTHPSYTATTAAAKKIGCDSTGHVVFGSNLEASDVGAISSSGTNLTGGFIWGSDVTKIGLEATNTTDNIQYLFGATTSAPFLYNDNSGASEPTIWTGYTTANPQPTAPTSNSLTGANLKNIILSTSAPTSSNTADNGTIWIQYTA